MKPMIILFCSLISLNMLGQGDLNSALKLINSQQFEEAEKVLDELIKKDPANGDLYYYSGDALLKDYLSDTFSNSLDEYAKKAEAIFQTGIQKAPANVLNQVGMGAVTLLRTSDTIKADAYFSQAEIAVPLKIKKKDYTPQMAIILTNLAAAQLYGRVNRFKKAISFCERAMVINPEDPNVYLILGDIYIRQNDASNALRNYNQALMKDTKSPLPKIKIGNIYMRVPNLEAARPYFEEAQQIDSTFAPVYRSLGELWSMAGRHDLAKKYYFKYMQLSGNTTPAKTRYAVSLFKSKDYAGALNVIEEVLKVDDSRNYLNRLAGYSAFEKKPQELDKAKSYMDKFFADAKDEGIITRDYAYYGRILYKMANKDSVALDQAFANLRRAYAMDETDRALLTEIAQDYYYAKRYSEAIEMFQLKAQKGWTDAPDATMIARAYYNMKDYTKADEAFTALVIKNPKNIDAQLWLARTASQMDPNSDLGLAFPKFENLVNQVGTETDKYKSALQEAYTYLGYYHLNKKEYDASKEWYQKLYDLDPNNKDWKITSLNSFALIAYRQKNYSEAKDYYQQILKLDPGNTQIQQVINDLNKAIAAQQK
jgi:tetratricopeptide (TPR) repeat protein